jgi:sec-independent protein translocase protein TatC
MIAGTTMSNGIPQDPDDFFAETRMSFGDHIEDLRQHLWRAIWGFGGALILSFFIGHIVVDWITRPVKSELHAFYRRRQAKVLSEKKDEITRLANKPTPFRALLIPKKQLEAIVKGQDPEMDRPRIMTKEQIKARANPPTFWQKFWRGGSDEEDEHTYDDHEGAEGKFTTIPAEEKEKYVVRLWASVENPMWFAGDQQEAVRQFLDVDSPTTLNVQEGFFVWFKVCIVCGIVLGSPWIFWQIWMFVAAGLYPHEKRLVHVYLPISLFLFLAGVFVCELFVIPKAIEALLWFNEWLGFKPDMRLNEWLGFAIFMPVVFGISFQTPLVMVFMHRLGVMNADSFRSKRSYAWFAMAVFAAFVTPSVDALSMLFLWVPMCLLFELGIFLIRMSPDAPVVEDDLSESGELIEV